MQITHNNKTIDLGVLTQTKEQRPELATTNEREEILASLDDEAKQVLEELDEETRKMMEDKIVAKELKQRKEKAAREEGRRKEKEYKQRLLRSEKEEMNDRWFQERLSEMVPQRQILKLEHGRQNVERWLRMAYAKECEKRGRTYESNAYVESAMEGVSRWMTEDTAHWGMLMMGLPGVGKTTMAMAMRDVMSICTKGKKIMMAKATEIGSVGVTKATIDEAKNADVLIVDDLGLEPSTIKVYGNELSPITDIIYHRYDSRGMTIVTTNLMRKQDKDQLEERYGARISDRFGEMFARLTYSGKQVPSFRR